MEGILRSNAVFRVSCEDAADVTLRTQGVRQRRWSRVSAAAVLDADAGLPPRVFLKQFVEPNGSWRPDLLEFERRGFEFARETLGELVVVPRLLGVDRARRLLVFEHIEVESMDELLRADPHRFHGVIDAVLARMVTVLRALHAPVGARLSDLPRKERDYGGPATALNFKGIDIRNVGVDGRGEVAMFDFGRPFLAPIQDAGSSLLVTVGLLNWGRPLSRFRRGPDEQLLERTARAMAPFLDSGAVRYEMAKQRTLRLRAPVAGSALAGLFKSLGLFVVGRRYLDRLDEWLARSGIDGCADGDAGAVAERSR